MPEHCAVCGQPFELQTGFYFGTGYVSFALSVALLAISFVAWFFTIGMAAAVDDHRVYWWLGTIITILLVTQPLLQRLSRSIWIAFFVRYDPAWRNAPLSV
jgi:hypothetical protein